MTTRHHRQHKHGLHFRSSPHITLTQLCLHERMALMFRDVELGEFARLAVEDTPAGDITQLNQLQM
jgi:hypothetical protein